MSYFKDEVVCQIVFIYKFLLPIPSSLMVNAPHLEALIGQGSSVEGLLIGGFHFQSCVTVLFGLSKTLQLQVAQGSANTHTDITCNSLFASPAANSVKYSVVFIA